MVFQRFNLFPHMTALENIIEAPMHVRGVPQDEAVATAGRCSRASASATSATPIRASSRAASSSASRSRARSR